MDELDTKVYYSLKDSLRKANKNILEDNLKWGNMPIILIDFYKWEAFYFEDEHQTKSFLEQQYSSWDDEPPQGEDEELVLLKYCTDQQKTEFQHPYQDYKFYKEINGNKIYRERSFVEFEPELIINVYV